MIKKYLLAIVFGILSNLAFAPRGYGIFIAIALSGMLFLTAKQTKKDLFLLSWVFGFFHFFFGLYWIANALMIDASMHAILIPFALGGLSLALGIYPALTFLSTGFFKDNFSKIFAFAGFWTLFEWIRSWFLTGFPWNPLGSIWISKDETIQFASVAGVYGLSLLTAFFIGLSLPLFAITQKAVKQQSWHFKLAGIIFSVIVPFYALHFLLYSYGVKKLENNPTSFLKDSYIRLVQPNISQKLKWDRDSLEDNFVKHIEMNVLEGSEKNVAFIWGETASSYSLDTDNLNKRRALQDLPANSMLITGIVRTDEDNNYYNSLAAISKDGSVIDTYDKSHLVPFGEYVPLRRLLPINKITQGTVDFTKGDGLKIIKTPSLPPFTALICYEIIFSGRIKPKNQKPEWFLNLTNDGWYGITSGPFQHFAATRIRAIEEGIPVVRVANTGISAVIDSLGRVVAYVGLNNKGIIDSPLPKPLEKPTIFNLFGNKIPVIASLIFLLISILKKAKSLLKI